MTKSFLFQWIFLLGLESALFTVRTDLSIVASLIRCAINAFALKSFFSQVVRSSPVVSGQLLDAVKKEEVPKVRYALTSLKPVLALLAIAGFLCCEKLHFNRPRRFDFRFTLFFVGTKLLLFLLFELSCAENYLSGTQNETTKIKPDETKSHQNPAEPVSDKN